MSGMKSMPRGREDAEREIEEELRFHIEMRTRASLAAGMTAEEAKADALGRFGDYESVREACRKISRERLEQQVHLRAIRGFIWVMLGCGLTLRLTGGIETVREVGDLMSWIAVLWRLLLYLRAIRPADRHAGTGEQIALTLSAPSGNETTGAGQSRTPVPAHDQNGRTPVERLLADDERTSQ